LCLLVGILSIWRRPVAGLLRSLALVLLFLTLLNPQLKQEQRDNLSNIALVVVDHSDSQKITHRLQQTLILEKELTKKLKKIDNLDVRVIESRNSDDEARGTPLMADMNNGLADIPRDRLAGVFLITDGQIHDVPKAPLKLDLNVPVHAFITGRPGEFDRRLKLIEAPRFGIVDSSRQIRLQVLETGKSPSASSLAKIIIRREGLPDLVRRVRTGEDVTIDFDFPHAGQNILEVELTALPGELTLANNRLVLSAQGIRENLRVLLVSGEPHPGERTWRNLLRSDAAVDLVHFTILRPPEKQDGTPINQLSLIAFPTRELFSERLKDFDLVIFDRYRRRGVLPLIYLDNVARYVEEGGAVLIAAGAQFAKRRSLAKTPLAQIMPAYPTGAITTKPFKARVTKDGHRHPVTRALPGAALSLEGPPAWGRWFRLIDAQAQSGDVLMNGPDDKPLLLLDRRGEGRVAMLLSDHAWLWARGYDGGGPYNALFRRLSHWLMKEPDLEEEFLTARTKGRKLTIERRSMLDKIEPVEMISPTGKKTTIKLKKTSPGIWRRTLKAEVGGLYRLSSGELSAAIHVGRINSRELSNVTASMEPLAPLVQATGGTALWQGQKKPTPNKNISTKKTNAPLPNILMTGKGRQMYGPGWLALADRKAYQVRSSRLIPLFTGWLALALLLGALSITWLREGR
jgi:hypothetical protein